MRALILFLSILCLSTFANDDYPADDIGSTYATSVMTYRTTYDPEFSTTNNKHKHILRAKPETTVYIASNGEIHSAYLEQALIMLRKEYPNTSDMELAKAILAY